MENVPFPAITNLESALRHIREHSCEATNGLIPATLDVWFHALCINQSNVDEMNEQVRMMKDIYSQASHVLIWLGLGDPHSDYLFDNACNEPVIEFGDIVALIYGITRPFILRPVNDGTYHMVGFACVHGFMDPDVLSFRKENGLFEGLETIYNIS